MKTVFVVTTGSYSDFRIKGVFSSAKKADEYISRSKKSQIAHNTDYNDVEEWTLDELAASKEYTHWHYTLFLDDGAQVDPVHTSEQFGIPQNNGQIFEKVPYYQGRGIVRVQSCKSAAHAKKLAAEKRQEWLRNKK